MKSVKIADYMATSLVTFKPTDSVFAAMDTFLDRKISGAPVIDDEGRLVGMLSEYDIMQNTVQGGYYDVHEGLVSDFMHTPVDVVSPDADIFGVAERFIKEHRHRYPVVNDEGLLVGQISRRDVLRSIREHIERNIKPKRKPILAEKVAS